MHRTRPMMAPSATRGAKWLLGSIVLLRCSSGAIAEDPRTGEGGTDAASDFEREGGGGGARTVHADASAGFPDAGSHPDGSVQGADVGNDVDDGCPPPVAPSSFLLPLPVTTRVTDHGATPDDLIDDSAAIQLAIDAAGSGAGIGFPAGVYRISKTLHFRSDRNYLGEPGATLRWVGGMNQMLMEDPGAAIQNVIVQGLIFDGSGVAIWGETITIRGCTFENNSNTQFGPDHGLFLPNSLRSGHVLGNRFVNILGNGTDSNAIMAYGLDRTEIADNVFDDVYQGMHVSLDVAGRGSDVLIARNVGRKVRRMGIEVQSDSNAHRLKVIDNTFTDWGPPLGDSGNRIALSIVPLEGDDIRISGNRLVGGDTATWGMEVGGHGLVVENNYVEGFADGIAISTAPGAIVQNNTIVGSLETGILPYHAGDLSPGILIANNDLREVRHRALDNDGERTPGIVFRDNFVLRTGGFYPDDGQTQFVGLGSGPTGTDAMQARGNIFVQGAAQPPPGFSFVGIGSYGFQGSSSGMIIDGNVVASLSTQEFGSGVLGNAPGGHTGVTYSHNTFQHLAKVLDGTTAEQGGSFTALDNVALNSANSRPDFAASTRNAQVPSPQFEVKVGVCGGADRQLVQTGVSVASNSAVRWFFGDGRSSAQSNPEHLYPPGLRSTTILVMLDENGAVGLEQENVDVP